MPETLLVIPHYNDSERLAPFLAEMQATLPPHVRIVVSDDGSSPDEQARLREVVAAAQRRSELGPTVADPLFTPRNTGKGGAILRGWDALGEADWVAFADADGAVSAAEISRAEAFVRADSSTDALFGSRVKMLGRRVSRTVKRHLSGRIFATLVSVVGGVAAYDTQCGLKLVRARALRRLRPMLACEGFAFDVELCLLLLRGGHRVIEFPVDWHDVPGSKVRLLRDSWRMGREVFRIRQRVDSLQKAGRLTPPEPADPI